MGLSAEFNKVRGKVISHYYPTYKAHICYNPTASFGQYPETRVLTMLVFPIALWNISKAVIDNMKESLSSLSDCHWINQSVDIGLVEKPFQHTCLYHLQDCVVNGDYLAI
jgi:hypothetical protein